MGRCKQLLAGGLLVLLCMTGCGQTQSSGETEAPENKAAQTETAVQTEIVTESYINPAIGETEIEETAAMHCLLLGGSDGSWLFVDRDNGTLFYAPIPEQLTDASGKEITETDLKAGNQVDVYGNGIMLESYPGQYPGVTMMVVTAEGSEEDLAPYETLITQFFAEPDMSEPPMLSASYKTSLAAVSFVLDGPANYTWTVPAEGDEEAQVVTACGSDILHWDHLIENKLDGKTDMTLESDVLPEEVEVRRWPVSAYQTDDYDSSEAVTVETDDQGQLVIRDVEEGYIYGVFASWEQGEAEYAFVAGQLAQ